MAAVGQACDQRVGRTQIEEFRRKLPAWNDCHSSAITPRRCLDDMTPDCDTGFKSVVVDKTFEETSSRLSVGHRLPPAKMSQTSFSRRACPPSDLPTNCA